MSEQASDPEVAASPAEAQLQAEPTPSAERPRAAAPWWKPAPRVQRVIQALLPAVLAASAVGVHWWLNVPAHIRESPNDQGAKKPRPKKDDRAKRNRGRSAQRDEARTPQALDRDWARFRGLPFDDEPTRTDWARRHQAILSRAFVVARREAFDGAPDPSGVVIDQTACRSVRCRLVLRAPEPNELDMVARALERLQADGEPVWRHFAIEPAPPSEDAADAAKDAADGLHYLQITVAFRTDETDTRALEIEQADAEGGEQPDDEGEGGERIEPEGS